MSLLTPANYMSVQVRCAVISIEVLSEREVSSLSYAYLVISFLIRENIHSRTHSFSADIIRSK